MPNLIHLEVYNETIDLIEGRKEPGPVLRGMQEYYYGYGIRLYNLYTDEKYDKGQVIGYKIGALTNVEQGFLIGNHELNFFQDTLNRYVELCHENAISTTGLLNLTYPRPGIGIGYYFDRIWKNEIISQVGTWLCPELLKKYRSFGVTNIINSGFGVYTVFSELELLEATKQKIRVEALLAVNECDTHGLVKDQDIVSFDLESVLKDKYKGNLYYYYK